MIPAWLSPLASAATSAPVAFSSRFAPPADGTGRSSAVLMAFASPTGEFDEADVLLLERAATLRSHAGQVAFPGGATDPQDVSPAATALREAAEEVGLRPDTVDVLSELPALYLPPSGFVVTPVLAWWREPHEVGVVDPIEVAGVARVPLAELLDPANRFTVRHPSGYAGPGFQAGGLFVWGFTAMLLDQLFQLAQWERDWDRDVQRPLPEQGLGHAR